MPNSLRCKIKHLRHNGTLTERECDRILKALEQQPTRPTGKWIVCDVVKFGDFVGTEKYECSKCHHRVGAFKSNFCPNCGARMEESEGDECR